MTTAFAALVAGLVTSVHCAGMCGPLACSVCTSGCESQRLRAAAFYHLGRILSYATVGALCGFLGEQPLRLIFNSPAVVLPWLLVLAFALIALGIRIKIPLPAPVTRLVARTKLRAYRLPAAKGGLLLGLATPLLPCGPLYLLFGASLLTGSALKGAEFAIAFCLGTIPLLWVAQHSFVKLREKLGSSAVSFAKRALALSAVAIMVFRLQGTLTPPPAGTAQGDLPSCGCDSPPAP